jgi:hypothetical protein
MHQQTQPQGHFFIFSSVFIIYHLFMLPDSARSADTERKGLRDSQYFATGENRPAEGWREQAMAR